jgi:glucose-1-phosphate thymidylyltransferase
MKTIILAAGYATRLWPLTLNKPKPLLPIGKKLMIEHILTRLEDIKNINDIYIVTNTKFVRNFKAWKKNYRGRKRISVIDDGMKALEDRRGSIGDIIFSIDKKNIATDIVVVAGDNIFDFNLTGFIKNARVNSPSATIGLFDIGDIKFAGEYGIVALDRSCRITSFKEKPKQPKSTLAAMCLYYFPKQKIRLLKKYKADGNPLDLAGSFIKWLSRKEPVYGFIFKGRWLDIGDKKSLKRAQSIKWEK